MPKGKLLIIGGAEDHGGSETADMKIQNIKFKRFEILKSILSVSRKSIVIVTAASGIQDEVRRDYERAFDSLNYSPYFIQIRSKSDCQIRRFLEKEEEMGGIFFTGGDQSRLISRLSGTRFLEVIKQRYQEDEDFLVAGTSAGAMAMSDIMIADGKPREAILAQKIKLSPGFGLAYNTIIDTHFIKRGRFGRLVHAILLHPHHLGIGLGEDTALIIKNGEAECRGSGMVVIIDGSHIKNTNINNARRSEPIYTENLIVHLLIKGNRFSLDKRQLL